MQLCQLFSRFFGSLARLSPRRRNSPHGKKIVLKIQNKTNFLKNPESMYVECKVRGIKLEKLYQFVKKLLPSKKCLRRRNSPLWRKKVLKIQIRPIFYPESMYMKCKVREIKSFLESNN
jgi:hypothetical protein